MSQCYSTTQFYLLFVRNFTSSYSEAITHLLKKDCLINAKDSYREIDKISTHESNALSIYYLFFYAVHNILIRYISLYTLLIIHANLWKQTRVFQIKFRLHNNAKSVPLARAGTAHVRHFDISKKKLFLKRLCVFVFKKNCANNLCS